MAAAGPSAEIFVTPDLSLLPDAKRKLRFLVTIRV
jgi:hypothetical protein